MSPVVIDWKSINILAEKKRAKKIYKLSSGPQVFTQYWKQKFFLWIFFYKKIYKKFMKIIIVFFSDLSIFYWNSKIVCKKKMLSQQQLKIKSHFIHHHFQSIYKLDTIFKKKKCNYITESRISNEWMKTTKNKPKTTLIYYWLITMMDIVVQYCWQCLCEEKNSIKKAELESIGKKSEIRKQSIFSSTNEWNSICSIIK